jgi:hypothetical protein
MKAILQHRFDPPIEKCVHKTTRVVAAISSTNFLPTKSALKSSWSDSIIGDQCLNNLNPKYGFVAENRNSVTLNKKGKVVAARPIYSPNHYEVKSATLFVENMKLTNAEIFTSSKHCVGASANSVATFIPSPKDHQKVLPSATISHEEQGVQSSCVAEDEPFIDDIIDNISTGLSMITQEEKSNSTIVDVNGQRSNVFQSECNIKDKVCKLIMDGGSFTNAISLGLVHYFSLSTWRFPVPRYMQLVNQSGTLKITHKARVKFSIRNYVDIVDCAAAPLSACHLLLRRPLQFDLDATHSGRSNKYSFVHKGVHHVLKPMKENDIKAVFAHIKKKKDAIGNTSKLRVTLLQAKGNDAACTDMRSAPDATNKEKINDVATNYKRIVAVNP